MNVREATAILKKQFPNRKIVGYWVKSNGFVFNTKPLLGDSLVEPGQYLVTDDGKVYGTNPMRSKLNMDEMKKFN